MSGILYLRSGLPITITQSQSMLSTGITNNRPNTDLRSGRSSSPTIDAVVQHRCFQQVPTRPARSATPAATSVRGPGQFNIDSSVIKNTKIGRVASELRLEVFNLLNHPQFAQPERAVRQLGVRDDLGDAGEPVVRALRHDRAADAAGVKLKF